jgi:hypothetical protein
MTLKDRIKAAVAALDVWARPWARRSRWNGYAYEFLLFGLKQAWACLFGGLMLALLVGTHLFWPAHAAGPLRLSRHRRRRDPGGSARAEAGALGRGAGHLHVPRRRHGDGAVQDGPWLLDLSSPACCGSAACRCSPASCTPASAAISRGSGGCSTSPSSGIRRFWSTHILAVLIYANFFSHHYIVDFRVGLFALSALLFGRTWFVFTPDQTARRMPMLMGAVLVSLFIWFAENLGTFAGAWIYPARRTAAGADREDGRLVSVDADQLRAGDAGAPPRRRLRRACARASGGRLDPPRVAGEDPFPTSAPGP